MIKVKIVRMTLHYFKGVKHEVIEFGNDTTTIIGPNGCGKSTIMDAFFWCLWGKNAAGQSDQKFLIKTVDENGEEIPHVDHEVEMELSVNGASQVFRRVLTPKYDKDDVLKGNVTSYYWNEVPLKQVEYNEKVSQVINESVFKITTSTTAFLQMPWDKQRTMLMNMAGYVNDRDVAMAMDNGIPGGEAHRLLGILTDKTIEEYKREIDAKLKRVNEAMRDIPARIDEVSRNLPEMPDVKALESEYRELQEEMDVIETHERDEVARVGNLNKERNKTLVELEELRFSQQKALNDAEAAARGEIHKANQVYVQAEAKMTQLQDEERHDASVSKSRAEMINANIGELKIEVEQFEARIVKMREEWKKVNALEYERKEGYKCPLFNHKCHDEEACRRFTEEEQGSEPEFLAKKKARLAEINTSGKAMAQELKRINAEIEAKVAELNDIKAQYQQRCEDRIAKAAALDKIMKENPKRPLIVHLNMDDIQECRAFGVKIAALEAKLSGMKEVKAEDDIEAKAKKEYILASMGSIKVKMADKVAIDKAQNRIADLERELKSLGEQKASLEYEKDNVAAFEIAKTTMITERVNNMFSIVRFKMFQKQVNGDEVPACICLINGVAYNDANTASKINAGIDVASTLAKSYGVSAPMFIDNAESSGNIFNPGTSQRILLKFDIKAKKMKVDNEN